MFHGDVFGLARSRDWKLGSITGRGGEAPVNGRQHAERLPMQLTAGAVRPRPPWSSTLRGQAAAVAGTASIAGCTAPFVAGSGTVRIVSTSRPVTWYGSACEFGRRSSRYPR